MTISDTCPDPGSSTALPTNAELATATETSYIYGSQVPYVCKDCYSGGGDLVCGTNGEWRSTGGCESKLQGKGLGEVENLRLCCL